ncbi:hypothetical protein ABPG74_009110, partial [Tetrahymena malaccensis]
YKLTIYQHNMSSLSPLDRYRLELQNKQKGVQIFDLDGKLTPEAIQICKEIQIKQEELIPKTLDQFMQPNQSQDVAQMLLNHYEKRRIYRIKQIKKFIMQKDRDDQYFMSHQVSPTSNKFKKFKESSSPKSTEKHKEKRVKEIIDHMDYEQKLKLVRRLMKYEKLQHIKQEKEQMEKERLEQIEQERVEKEKKFEEQIKINEKKKKEELEKLHKKSENQKQVQEHIKSLQEQQIEERSRLQNTFFQDISEKLEKDKAKEQEISKRNYHLYLQRSGEQRKRESNQRKLQELWLQQSNMSFNSIVNDINSKNIKKNNQILDRIRSHSTKNEYWKEVIQKNQLQNWEIDQMNKSVCMERFIAAKVASPRLKDFSVLSKRREEMQSSAQKRREDMDEQDIIKRDEMLLTLRSKMQSADKSRYNTNIVNCQKNNIQKQFQRDDVVENLKFHQFSIRCQREKEIRRTKYKTIMAEKKKKLKEDILYVTNQGIKDISSQLRSHDLVNN